ncbi:MAG TPA: hypothetical protein DEB31_01895 [Clostridiales bacterium]|nr:hypothetical protein [Clostridiales bacterium]
MKRWKKPVKVLVGILAVIGVVFAVFGIKWAVKSAKIDDDYTAILTDAAYSQPVAVRGVTPIEQEISCGYAVIEMLASRAGKDVTEESLFAANGDKVTTAMGSGFERELAKQFPEYTVRRYENLSNSEVLEKIYVGLANGFPVPIEFAALYGGTEWTLHFALVTAMDLQNDSIEVVNPYGYIEYYTVEELLAAMRYESYENMPFFLRLGFLAEIFTRNTLYTME